MRVRWNRNELAMLNVVGHTSPPDLVREETQKPNDEIDCIVKWDEPQDSGEVKIGYTPVSYRPRQAYPQNQIERQIGDG